MALSKLTIVLGIVLPILLGIGIVVIVYFTTREKFDDNGGGGSSGGGGGGDSGGGGADPEIPNNPFIFAYNTNVINTRVGTAINIVPETFKIESDSMDVKPPLPDGLTIDETTGVISGTPTTFTELAVTYEVTASFEGELLASAHITMEVLDLFPNFEYLGFPAAGYHVTNGAIVAFFATMVGDTPAPQVQHWTKDGMFDWGGVTFDEENGRIFGVADTTGPGFDNIVNITVTNGSSETQEFHMRFFTN